MMFYMIHRFTNNEHRIVMDINSGSIHEVDELVYDMVDLCDKRLHGEASESDMSDELKKSVCEDLRSLYPDTDASEIDEAFSEITELVRREELFTPDSYEDKIYDYSNRPVVVKALCLHVAHDCNLACRYCFASEGEYNGARGLMSYEVGKAALDFLIANSGSRRNLEVDFFGGEPLLNFEVVKKLVAYGRSQERKSDKHFRFTLTTNGVLLNDEITDFLNREMDNVVLSIDGRKDVHDRMRPYRGGAASYDKILPNLIRFREKRGDKKYYVRGTFTRNNLDFSKDVLHLNELGFKEISVEPVVASPSDDYAIPEDALDKLYAEYDALAAEMVRRIGTDKEFNFFHFMIDLEGGPCVYKRLSGCGSGTEYLAVTPDGELYPCHQFVGKPEYLMGDVYNGVTNAEARRDFASVNVYQKSDCRKCFAKFYCSGGCAANAYNFHGDIRATYELGCALQKKRIECAIMIKAATAALEGE